jgi:FkbM family methyltransferase
MLIPLSEICNKYSIQPNTVLHVGACQMEELEDYLKNSVNKVIWIDANPDLVELNREKALTHGHDIFHGLVFDEDDVDLDFHISNNLQSSSILDFDKHSQYHPHVEYTGIVRMKTTRLDSLLKKHGIESNSIDFLNLDIQGVELKAIKGLGSYLDSIRYIYTEVNVGEVYKCNDRIEDLDEFLISKGFERIETKITPYEWGDALYTKK